MRAIAVCLGIAVAVGTAFGQADLGQVAGAIKSIRDNNDIGQPVTNPLQPTGNPGPPAKIPPLEDDNQSPDFQLNHADTITTHGHQVTLDGNVEFIVKGYRVVCDYATINRTTEVATLRGHIHIDGELFTVVEGKQVTVDFINETYESLDSESQLSPELVKGALRDKLYVKGHDTYGSERETVAREGSMTTCNYPAPHYEIDGDSIVIRPARRAIFRKTRIRVLGHTILNLPFLSIPLNERTYHNTPVVGESPDEGYFIKMRYGIPTKNPDYNVDTCEEYMTKLGLGLGGDYTYQALKQAGIISVYHIFGPSDDLILSNTHHQVFNWGTVSLQNDYEKDNYLVNPNGTTLNTQLNVNVPEGTRGSDRFSFSEAYSSSFGYATQSQSFGIADQRNFGSRTQTSLNVTYFGTNSQFQESGSSTEPTSNSTQRMDVNFQAQQDLTAAQAMLQYQRSIPIGSTQTFIGASDETPVLSLQSDARRLLGTTLGQEFPFKTTLSWGDFQDPQTQSSISRGYFDFDFNRIDPSRGKFHVDTNGDFRQGIYSDGAAEYVETFGTNIRYDLGQNTGFNLRYNYEEPFGYAPLSIDQTGKTDFLSEDLNAKFFKSLLLGAQSGFDFLRMEEHQIGWQPVGLRLEYTPTKWFMFRGLSNYDTFQQKWSTTEMDLTYAPGATRLAIGATYDGESHTWTDANLFLDHLKIGRTTLATALSYNGYLKMFESEQLSAIYDLHCVEAVFTYQENNYGFRSGNQFQFFLRIKAFPTESPFGVGTRGQPIGLPSTGSVIGG